jgi:ComF family protein
MAFGSALLDLLFPPRCAFCGKVTDEAEDGICPKCRNELPRSGREKRKADFVRSVTAPLYYEGTVREALLRYKFHYTPVRGRVFGRMIGEELLLREETDFDVLTWVPLSDKRRRRRGYDQARILAEAAAEVLGTQAVPLLKKVRNAPPQSGIRTPEARRANVSGCYIVPDPSLAEGKRILVVDDIITTGATVSECARMLMLSGAEEVRAASLAVRRHEKRPLEPYEVTDI